MRKKVLLAFDDPGGGLAVSSLIDRLKAENFLELKIYTGNLSENFVNCHKSKKLKSRISKEEAERILDEISPDILVTGTGGGNAEQELRNTAFERKIKSVVILDFWKDYKRRWLYALYPIELMTDKVCVMDDLAKDEMINDGFPEKNLIVTGHPYLDKIFYYNKRHITKNKSKKNNFLFLSQPLHIIGLKNYKIHPLKILLKVLTQLSEVENEKISLTVKLHPSEKLSMELSSVVNEFDSAGLKVKFANEKSKLKNLIEKSEVVIGYNTIAMFEARALNKRTISLNVVPVKKSLVNAMESAGIEIVDISKKKSPDNFMKRNDIKQSSQIYKGGIENCVQVILSELSLN
ncbi:MAG: hypothetical protein ABI840_04910 [bacterium]